jgi:N-acetylglucosamine-6-phosphate deacetylase
MVTLLTADSVVSRDRVLHPGWVEIERGRIRAVGEGTPPRPATAALGAVVLVPGFVDVHCHGGGGSSFGSDLDAAATAIAAHRAHGTTTLVASLVSAPVDTLRGQVDALAELVTDGQLAGVHLEGPWLSTTYCGAHDPRALRPPTRDDVQALVRPDVVRMVTLAPELDGAVDAVRATVAAGAVAAVGHTAADARIVRDALRAGASHATHLFNSMPPLHHRDPGAVLALLDSGATLELIRDGVHVSRDLCGWLDATIDASRMIAVTDAMAAAAAPDGDYPLGALDVIVREGVARVAVSGVLAGSTATADVLFHDVAHGTTDRDLLRATAQTATNPAAALDLHDVGELRPGAYADVVVLDRAALTVTRVMRRGDWIS